MFGVGSVNIDRVMKGSIDMHIHHGPGGGSFSAYDLAVQAGQAGMRAIVLKDTGYPNAPMAELINRLVPGTTLYGSQCLNAYCGGLNPMRCSPLPKWAPRSSGCLRFPPRTA